VKVVKALNTMNCDVMVDPARLSADSDTFVCGNDARGTEAYVLFWVRMTGALGTPHFNVKIVR
jgi:hypothetical protein